MIELVPDKVVMDSYWVYTWKMVRVGDLLTNASLRFTNNTWTRPHRMGDKWLRRVEGKEVNLIGPGFLGEDHIVGRVRVTPTGFVVVEKTGDAPTLDETASKIKDILR